MSGARADRLAELVTARGLDALIVSDPMNVRYLSGFTGTNGLCVVGAKIRTFLTDFRYVERAEREVEAFDRLRGKQDLFGDAAERLGETGAERVGFEDHKLTVRANVRLRAALPDSTELVPAGDLVEDLRAVKDRSELDAIRAAADAADGVFEYLRETGFGGRTEREVARDLEREMRARGTEPSFPPIVAAGANGSLPHAAPGDDVMGRGTLVVVDFGCLMDGYCSDCTRTFATGPLDDDADAVYGLVHDAQAESRAAVMAGADCRSVDAVAREAIAAGGHGDEFGHGLGHGVGLEVHEAPRMGRTSDDVLQAGDVVSVEPGVYVPGRFGVRIEDLVVVTDDGIRNLSGTSKDLRVVD